MLLGTCIWALAVAHLLGSGEAHASSAAAQIGESDQDLYGVYNEGRSLSLSVGRHPEIHKRAAVRATGFAESALELWVYADPRGRKCPAEASAQRPGARTVFSAVPVEGDFRVAGRFKLKDLGRHSFCAYLGLDDGSASTNSFTSRKVRRPLLQAPRARHAVAAALRGHEFADRVVENLEQRCRRRSRAMFSCRFSSGFPGYRLTGHGQVRLNRHLSYRFRVRVGDLRLVLTDDNEGPFPG